MARGHNGEPDRRKGLPMTDSTRDIVLFLGAGFSKSAKLPAMSEFLKFSLEKELRGLQKTADRRPAIPMLIKAGEAYEGFAEFCSRARQYVHLETGNMEAVFCIAESVAEAGISDLPYEEWGVGDAQDLKRQIQRWLWKIYQRCDLVREMQKSYSRFAGLLSRPEIAGRTTVLTTNYDLVMEYILWHQDRGHPPFYPDMGAEWITVQDKVTDAYLSKALRDDSVLICKLHGSVNYFSDGSTPTLYITNDVAGRPAESPTGGFLTRDGAELWRPAIFALNAIHDIKQKGDYTPAIIPPTYAKLTADPWLRETWRTAHQSLATARLIIFIGYSMPESDGFMKALVQSAMACRSDANKPDVYVVDPYADEARDTGRRYQTLFRPLGDKLHLLPKTFEDAVGDIEEMLVSA